MSSINLLPEQEKKRFSREEVLKIARFFSSAGTAVFIFAAILMLPSYFYLTFGASEFARALKIEEDAYRSLGVEEKLRQIKDVRVKLGVIRDYAASAPSASALIEKFLESDGNGIAIANLIIRKDGSASIGGTAETRRDLLNFEKKLRDANIFRELNFPISNIIREADINFSLQGKLNPEHSL